MRRRSILTLLVVALVFGSLVTYRLSQLPSLLTVSVGLDLFRIRDDGYLGTSPVVSVNLATTNTSFNNVTFVGNPYGNKSLTSEVHWKLQIVLNESVTTNVSWECNIDPGPGSAGRYSGVVSNSFVARGSFKVWVVLWSVFKTPNELLWSYSEVITVYKELEYGAGIATGFIICQTDPWWSKPLAIVLEGS